MPMPPDSAGISWSSEGLPERALAAMRFNRYNVPVRPRRRLRLALAASVLFAVLPLGGGALGATSIGANGDIAFVNGGNIHFVTAGTQVAGGSDPSWSPNGLKLAYVVGGSIKVCTDYLNCAGTTGAALDTTSSQPVWSPNGNTLAYVKSGHIFTVPAAGGSATQVTTVGSGD